MACRGISEPAADEPAAAKQLCWGKQGPGGALTQAAKPRKEHNSNIIPIRIMPSSLFVIIAWRAKLTHSPPNSKEKTQNAKEKDAIQNDGAHL